MSPDLGMTVSSIQKEPREKLFENTLRCGQFLLITQEVLATLDSLLVCSLQESLSEPDGMLTMQLGLNEDSLR